MDILATCDSLMYLAESSVSDAARPLALTNDAAAVCNNIYETVKRQTLSMYPWSFALTKLQLTKSGTSPR